MIYTCYEMIRDCRADRAEGWAYLVSHYVAPIRQLLAHYGAGDADTVRRVMLTLRQPECSLFQSAEPTPERWFVARLRQVVLAELPAPTPAPALELESVATAWEPLTLVEKQAAWLEGMRYSSPQTGVLLRMDAATVEKVRARAAGLLRGCVDYWNQSLLPDNGRALGLAATAAATSECLSPKLFLDLLDGRTTWRGREEIEQHVLRCWHCIDHFCRLVEVVELLRGNQPLAEAEAAALRELLGVRLKQPAWKRWLGA